MKFFFDTSISHRVVDALLALQTDLPGKLSNVEIVHHRQRFPDNLNDYDWLNTLVIEGGWIVVSADPRITTNPLEKKIWREKPIVLFVLEKGWKGQKLWDRAWRIVKVWPQITEIARKAKQGSAYKITVNGKITKL